MPTITIHADDLFAEALREYARRSRKSVNQTVKDLLSPILGIAKKHTDDKDNPFMKFCGVLPKADGADIETAINAQRVIYLDCGWRT